MPQKPLAELLTSGESAAPELSEALDALLVRCRATWPAFSAPTEAFVAYLSERAPESMTIAEWLERVHASDLFLAFACWQREDTALSTFEDTFGPGLDQALRKFGSTADLRDDARQILRERLFVGGPDQPPKIAAYSGRGALRSWLRITATRILLELSKREQKEPFADDEELLGLPSPDDDPETLHLKELYGAEFKSALERSITELPDRSRILLAQYHLDGLTIDQLGAQYRVHRMTAARWVAAARRDLLIATRRRLEDKLALSKEELDSVLRLIRSRLDLSISRVLRKH